MGQPIFRALTAAACCRPLAAAPLPRLLCESESWRGIDVPTKVGVVHIAKSYLSEWRCGVAHEQPKVFLCPFGWVPCARRRLGIVYDAQYKLDLFSRLESFNSSRNAFWNIVEGICCVSLACTCP